MKRNIFPSIGLFALLLFNVDPKRASVSPAQNNDYLVSMEGIGSLKLHMAKADIEKLLQSKITLKHIGTGGFSDTVLTKYKGMDMTLFLDESDPESVAMLRGIQTSNPACRTLEGIGAGNSKMDAINAYPAFRRYVAPEYEEYPRRSPTRSIVAVQDTLTSGAIIFHIENRKVTSVQVQSYYEFD